MTLSREVLLASGTYEGAKAFAALAGAPECRRSPCPPTTPP